MTYSNSLTMNRQRFAARQQNTARFNVQTKTLGPVSNTIALLILSCLLGLLYLTQVTKTNALSYRLDDLRTQEKALKTEHNELEITAARLQSLDRIKNSEVTSKLASVSPTNLKQD
jgi:hypothetical protein